jgi:hypothetical protein
MIREKNITYIQSRYRGLKGKKTYEKLKLGRAIKLIRLIRHIKKFVKKRQAERAEQNRIPDKDSLNRITIDNIITEKAASKIQKHWRQHNTTKQVCSP